MTPSDELTIDDSSFCLAEVDNVYTIFLHPNSKTTTMDLGNSKKKYSVQWYNPRFGGALKSGTVSSIEADGLNSIGSPPADLNKDWVALIKTQ